MSNPGRAGSVSDSDILRAIRDHYAPAVGTQDIADAVGISRQAVDRRLRNFRSNGWVETDKIGRSRIWWLTTDGKKQIQQATE